MSDQVSSGQMSNEEYDSEQEKRREYWAEQMNQAYDFMQMMREYPVQECGEVPVSLIEAARGSGVEIEFSDSPIALDMKRRFYLREGQIEGFLNAAREMNNRGWIMKVEDGFRAVEMQRNLSRKPAVFDAILTTTMWELGGEIPEPGFLLKRVAALTAIRPKVGTHMSCSAIDISVLHRDGGEEVLRGGPYLEMSELTPMASPFVSFEAQENRREITDIMQSNGFVAYPFEFWHYNGGDCYGEFLSQSGEAARYGAIHFDELSGTIEPVADPDELLQPLDAVQHEIEQSLKRLAS
jgi:D-alanyl-D-alanine dipeptidase